MKSRFDFSNYRNLAARAENSGHVNNEVYFLRKCLEVLPHSEKISADTLAAVHDRLAKLEALLNGRQHKGII